VKGRSDQLTMSITWACIKRKWIHLNLGGKSRFQKPQPCDIPILELVFLYMIYETEETIQKILDECNSSLALLYAREPLSLPALFQSYSKETLRFAGLSL